MTESTYAFDKVRTLADLPKHEGFKFVGICKDGRVVDCEIVCGMTCIRSDNGAAFHAELTSWRYKKKT